MTAQEEMQHSCATVLIETHSCTSQQSLRCRTSTLCSGKPRWIDPEEAGTNVGVSTSTFLTLVAYLFAITVRLPKVSYVTRMDRCPSDPFGIASVLILNEVQIRVL